MSARVHLCGRLRVEWDGEALEDALPGRQGRLLFAFFALHRDRVVRRDELVETLWPDVPGGDALLRAPLSRLRSALGQGRLEGRTELRVRFPARTWVDREAIRDGLRASWAATAPRDAWNAAREALALAEDDLLPELEGAWLEPFRAELAQLRVELLEAAALAGAGLGPAEQGEAERAARRAVEAAPFRESARAALIEVLRRRGNTAEALVAYDEARTFLRDELGTAPGPQLRALHDELLGARPGPAADQPLPDRLVQAAATTWVGRDEPLAALASAAGRARDGSPAVVLLAGHGGIGKTRLVAELARSLKGFDVLYGRCEDEQLFPFGPWLELLSDRLAAMPDAEVAALLGPAAPSVVRLLPELRARLGGDVADPVRTDPETERRQLFTAVTRIVSGLAARRPVLLVLDDLQWADRSSLLLARHVAGEPQLGPVLLLGTVRDTELGPGHPLPGLLADLERHRTVERIRLAGMDEQEVAALIGSLHADDVEPSAVRAIRTETGGNPFFVRQLVRHLEEARGGLSLDGDIGVPEGLRDVIAERVSRLPAGADEVLEVAALIGRDFGFELLGDVVDRSDDALLDVLDAAVRGGLLTEVGAGRWSFVHALVRTTLAGRLSRTRDAVTHRRIGEAIERRHGERLDPWLAALAHHLGAAGPERAAAAVGYAERAAEQAAARLAYDQAADLLADAIELLPSGDAGPDPGEVARLAYALGTYEAGAGRPEQSRASFERSAAAARAAGDPHAFALAALGHSGGTWDRYARTEPGSAGLLEEALDGLDDGDSVLRVRVLARFAEVLYQHAADERLGKAAEAALAMARRLGDAEALQAALTAMQFARWQPGRAHERLALARELVAVTDPEADPIRAADAYVWRLMPLVELCRLDEAEADMARHAELAERSQQHRLLVHRDAMRACRANLRGDFEAGAAAAQDVLDRSARTVAHGGQPGPNDVPFFLVCAFGAHCERGRLPRLLPELEDLLTQTWNIPAWRTTLPWAYHQAGRTEEARAVLADLTADDCAVLLDEAFTVAYLALLAHAAVELDDTAAATALLPLLAAHREEWVLFGLGAATLGPVAYHVGTLQALLDRPDEALPSLELALERAQAMGARPYVARSRAALAGVLRRRDEPGDGARAEELSALADADAEALGMCRLLGEPAG